MVQVGALSLERLLSGRHHWVKWANDLTSRDWNVTAVVAAFIGGDKHPAPPRGQLNTWFGTRRRRDPRLTVGWISVGLLAE